MVCKRTTWMVALLVAMGCADNDPADVDDNRHNCVATLSQDECIARRCQTMTGDVVRVERGCIETRAYAGCSIGWGAGDAVSYGYAPNGLCWRFPTQAQPEGYTTERPTNAECNVAAFFNLTTCEDE